MKKSGIAMLVLSLLFSMDLYAADNIFKPAWWKNATIADVKSEFVDVAKINIQNSSGRTPLMAAVTEVNNPDILKIILKPNVNLNQRDKNGMTALMYACKYAKDDKAIKLLLRNKADVSIIDNRGKTAIDYVEMNKNIQPKYIANVLRIYAAREQRAPFKK